jgi:hypothetical protein
MSDILVTLPLAFKYGDKRGLEREDFNWKEQSHGKTN